MCVLLKMIYRTMSRFFFTAVINILCVLLPSIGAQFSSVMKYSRIITAVISIIRLSKWPLKYLFLSHIWQGRSTQVHGNDYYKSVFSYESKQECRGRERSESFTTECWMFYVLYTGKSRPCMYAFLYLIKNNNKNSSES